MIWQQIFKQLDLIRIGNKVERKVSNFWQCLLHGLNGSAFICILLEKILRLNKRFQEKMERLRVFCSKCLRIMKPALKRLQAKNITKFNLLAKKY
jgi:hypothetical protein